MKIKNFYKFTRAAVFTFCIIFLCSSFDFKLATIKAFHIVEIANNDFYTDLEKTEIANYTFLYDNSESEKSVDFINSALEKHKSFIMTSLDLETEPKITFRVLSKFNTSQKNSLGYIYFHNNIINILNRDSHGFTSYIKDEKRKDKIFTETIIHEYTHALINSKFIENNNFPKKLPFWFNEGIAEYMGRICTGKTIPKFVLSDVKPSELDKLFDKSSDKFYEYSCIFIKYIVDTFGVSSIGSILNYLDSYSFEKAIEKATGSTLDEISLEVFNTTYK